MSNSLPLEQLEQQLERAIENVRQVRIVVSDFQPQGQPGLNQKLQQIVRDLGEIDKLRPSVADIQVPLDVFDYIDSGRNPQLYTKDCMEKAHSKNGEVKGKIDAYRMFKARLLVELSAVFPNEMKFYRANRVDERGNQIQESVKQNISDFDIALETAISSFPQERAETVRSIVTQEYQKFIKSNYKSSHSSENRRKLFQNFVSSIHDGAKPGIIINLAKQNKTSPALVAKIILEEYLKKEEETEPGDKRVETALRLRVNQLLKNHALVPDRDLSYEILLAKLKDHSYGPLAEAIKHSIGEEHEQKLKDCLNALNIPFSDEHVLRGRGYDKTPDVKLEVPISLNGKIINWIESKALFGDRESHEGYLRDQFWSYWNRFGSGLVIYWFGYIKQLDSNSEAGIVLTDHFPAESEITRYDPKLISQRTDKLVFLGKAEKGRRSVSDILPSRATDTFSTSFGELSIKESQ